VTSKVDVLIDLPEGVLRTPLRAKPVREVRKSGLKNRLDNNLDGRLNNAVRHDWNAQWPLPTIRLGYVDATHRRSPVGLASQDLADLPQQGLYSILLHRRDRLPINASGTFVRFDVRPSLPQYILPIDLANPRSVCAAAGVLAVRSSTSSGRSPAYFSTSPFWVASTRVGGGRRGGSGKRPGPSPPGTTGSSLVHCKPSSELASAARTESSSGSEVAIPQPADAALPSPPRIPSRQKRGRPADARSVSPGLRP